jgi:mono/diheme cytochrome c family protein
MPRILGSLAAAALTIALSARAADLAEGIDLYRNHCAACHGVDGEGDGPAAPAMRTPVPNLRILARRNGDVFPADAVTAYIDGTEIKAAHGDRQMPIWGEVFRSADAKKARERIDSLVEFLRTMQEAPRPAQR